jgi:prevent-host-death family protein
MRTNTRDIVSVSDAAKNFSRYASEVAEGRSIVIVRNNEPTAALVPLDRMDRLDKLDELEEDLLLWGIALARTITDSGERHSLEDVAAEFGVDLDDDGESVEEH